MRYNFITFASDSYMSRYKVLEASIQKHHPDSFIHLYELGEQPSGGYLQGLAKLRLEKVLELLEQGLENVVLIGADCELFAPMHAVSYNISSKFFGKEPSDIILVPHITQWYPEDTLMPGNRDFYMTGHCNADFIVFRNCENTKNVLKELIKLPMHDDKRNGVFYEQTWLSALPFMYENVYVLKDPGYNVAYFNILQRDFKWDGQKYTCGNSSLVLFQYSGFDKAHPEQMSKHQNRGKATGDILKIFKEYAGKI